MCLKILKISQGGRKKGLNIMEDKVLAVGVSFSGAGEGAARLEISSRQHRPLVTPSVRRR